MDWNPNSINYFFFIHWSKIISEIADFTDFGGSVYIESKS